MLILLILQTILHLTFAATEIDPRDFERTVDLQVVEDNSKWRMADADLNLRWRNATITYQIALTAFDESEINGLHEAMDIFSAETCLKFKLAKPSDPFSVIIRMGNGGCNAILGQYKEKGTQTVNLGYGCRYYGLFLHELGHTIGLHHEHQHPDRDQGVRINMANVEPSMRQWFETIDRRTLNMYGVPYDIQSIMHYGQHAFSTYENNKATISIVAKDPNQQKYLMYVYMKDLSFGDSKRINLMYKCNAHCPSNIPCPSNGFINKRCECEMPAEFAKRRCVDKATPVECEKLKQFCSRDSHPSNMYQAFYKCRKTCNACYEAI